MLKTIFATPFSELNSEKIGKVVVEVLDYAMLHQRAKVSLEQKLFFSFKTFSGDKSSNALEHLQTRLAVSVSLKKRLSRPTGEVQRNVRNNRKNSAYVSFDHIAQSIVDHKEAGIDSVSLLEDFVDKTLFWHLDNHNKLIRLKQIKPPGKLLRSSSSLSDCPHQ